MSKLFSPYQIGSLTLRNRIVVSPMSQHMASGGMPGVWHGAHLSQFALGGAGLVFVEATAVSADAIQCVDDLGIWSDEHGAAFAPIVDQVHACGAHIGLQLGHAGRKAGTSPFWKENRPLTPSEMEEHDASWHRMSASSISVGKGWSAPRALDLSDIVRIKGQFRDAARRARNAGFDVLELHFAHGYLVASFLSPLTNHRSDSYGGSFDGRIRLALEIVAEVRQEWPTERPLFCRISAVDGSAEGGWNMEDSVRFSQALIAAGVDIIDCSSGGIGQSPTQASRGLGFQVPYAEQIKREAQVPVVAVGYILGPQQAEAVVAEGRADAVAIGRAALFDPYWPLHAARELLGDVRALELWPQPYAKWLTAWSQRLEENGTSAQLSIQGPGELRPQQAADDVSRKLA
ncbi:NADH:flavin oxidoreductase/NADH oxidase [Achromobacter spanius]|uniref:NADH:flavin oxidoreductase/NADH oxidase n=1 Tax=Achromobacter spanius TaxID=217203 RepID=UPI0036F0A719